MNKTDMQNLNEAYDEIHETWDSSGRAATIARRKAREAQLKKKAEQESKNDKPEEVKSEAISPEESQYWKNLGDPKTAKGYTGMEDKVRQGNGWATKPKEETYSTAHGTITRYITDDPSLQKHGNVWYKFKTRNGEGKAAANRLYAYITADILFDLMERHPEDFTETFQLMKGIIK